jgi:predicted nucleic acid-binding Zn ribbon protein
MSSTLLRLALWIAILALAAYVVSESMEGSAIAEMLPMHLMTKVFGLSAALAVAGFIAKLFEKTKERVTRNRCRVCGTPVASGAIYCRAHLRQMLDLEDRKTHNTRIR